LGRRAAHLRRGESMVHGEGIAVPNRWPSDAPPAAGADLCTPALAAVAAAPAGAALRNVLWYLHPGQRWRTCWRFLPAMWPARCWAGWWLVVLPPVPAPRCLATRGWLRGDLARCGQHRLGLCALSFQRESLRSPASPASSSNSRSSCNISTDARPWPTGLWAGLLLNTKYIYALAFPGALLLVVLVHRKDLLPWARRSQRGLGFLPGLLMVLLYNFLRFGSVTNTGYSKLGDVMWRTSWSARGAFCFRRARASSSTRHRCSSLCSALPGFWRSHRGSVLAMLPLSAGAAVLLSFALLPGDFRLGSALRGLRGSVLASGHRFSLWRAPTRALAGAALLVVGLCVQLLGNAFYWDHFICIGLDVRSRWLGLAQSQRLLTADKGGFCEAVSRQLSHGVAGPIPAHPRSSLAHPACALGARPGNAPRRCPWRRSHATQHRRQGNLRTGLASTTAFTKPQIPDDDGSCFCFSWARAAARRSLRSTHARS